MSRIFLTVLDAVGAGEAPDAADYGDTGANTLGHVIASQHPKLPNMARLGLARIPTTGYPDEVPVAGAYGRAVEKSKGKDTTSGHWEIAGVQVKEPFPTFPDGFPEEFIRRFEQAIGHKCIGNKPASGTVILEELGEAHLRDRTPIVYTSADSVFQIACHEEIFPVDQLYDFCRTAREMLQGELGVGRVIARPFVGKPGSFVRTGNRRDFSLPPCGRTLPDAVKEAGMASIGVGKIEDIFAHRGLTVSDHAAGNPACMDSLIRFMREDFNGLCFTNLVDTDSVYGHRNDPAGFAGSLEAFDRRLPEMLALMREGDLMIITADHGCDPCDVSTDHTREYIPILAWTPGMTAAADLGDRDTYADIAATCAEWLGLEERFGAKSFATELGFRGERR
ncbi:MAG: phosphopentomutase [Clostridia bacterium]|nr:phosphopentomutase [Clostridia bacterium]